jgi:hypothetical protein
MDEMTRSHEKRVSEDHRTKKIDAGCGTIQMREAQIIGMGTDESKNRFRGKSKALSPAHHFM